MKSIFDIDEKGETLPKVSEVEQERSEDEPGRSKKREIEGLTPSEILAGKRRLSEMVTQAFAVLDEATKKADFPTAIKAAQMILDRAGFGAKSTVDVNAVHTDLSSMSREELAERAARVTAMLREKKDPVQKNLETTH